MTAPQETVDVASLFEFQQHGCLAAVGAEAIDVSSSDATPSALTKDGNAMTPRGIFVGTAGDVKVDMADGITAITFKNVPVGVFPIAVSKVYHTGTAASQLVLLY